MTSEMLKFVCKYNFSIALTKINLKKSLWPPNAPTNVFPQHGEGGHTGAIDIDVLPVSGASEQLLTQGSPQGRDY